MPKSRITEFQITNILENDHDRLSVFIARGSAEREYMPTHASANRLNQYCKLHPVKIELESFKSYNPDYTESYIWVILK